MRDEGKLGESRQTNVISYSVPALPTGADKLDHLLFSRGKFPRRRQDKIHNCFNFVVRRCHCDSRGTASRIFQEASPILSFLRLHFRFYLSPKLRTRLQKKGNFNSLFSDLERHFVEQSVKRDSRLSPLI